jgi:hypothetical protein
MPNEQTSVPLFASGEVLTASNMNLSAGTGVPVFATTTTRDAAFGGAGEKVLAEGQLCYLSSTNVTQQYNGTSWETVGPATAGGLVFISSTTITAATSTTISNIFTSTYNDYKMLITLRGSSDSNKLRMTLTTGGTPVTTGYAAGNFIGDYSAGSPTTLSYGYAGSARFELGYIPNNTGNPTINANIQLDVFGPEASQRTALNGLTTSVWSGAANAGGMIIGFLDSLTSYDGVQITNSSGTNMTGTVVVYGYAKA